MESLQHREARDKAAKKLRSAFRIHVETSILNGDLYTDNQYAKDCRLAQRRRYQMQNEMIKNQSRVRRSIGDIMEDSLLESVGPEADPTLNVQLPEPLPDLQDPILFASGLTKE